MTIQRDFEGVFIIVEHQQQQHQQQQSASPLMDADEAAALEMLEGIEDEIWRDYLHSDDDSSFFYPSSEEGSSIGDDEDDFDDFEYSSSMMIMDNVDFPLRYRESRHTAVRRAGGRRPTTRRLEQLQNEIDDVDFLSLPTLQQTLDEMVENAYDEDSVVLTTRRGVRRHDDQQHRQLQQTEEEESFDASCTSSACIKLSERSSQSFTKS
mmetsp:Transcript_124948/g.176306  ORF Transcript_124948/g.176306 Transcript_124948/m.176306 type:complete len:209 (-) Transcript_124948:57-683(-)